MARFFRKIVKRKSAPKKVAKKAPGGRRLGLRGSASKAVMPTPYQVGYEGGKMLAKALTAPYYNQKRQARNNASGRLNLSDGISTAPAVVIGKQRKIDFREKVTRSFRPPIEFKRNYNFSAEGFSGRKAWFGIDLNQMISGDLATDITTYKASQLTNTASADVTVLTQTAFDGAQFYVDKLSERIKMMNTSTNSVIGKIHLVACKRDSETNYTNNVPIVPVNMMMLYSTFAVSLLANSFENIVTNGWKFDSTTATANYQNPYYMPGSSLNSAGTCASTDSTLSLFHPSIKKQMGFWFRNVKSQSFSLKPGQQCNYSFIFNDLKKIYREQQEYVHLAGITYHIVVEFEGQIVGDSAVGSSVVSTGTTQLSVIRDSTRIMGLTSTLKPVQYLLTSPQSIIPDANQQIINEDSGIVKVGTEKDL